MKFILIKIYNLLSIALSFLARILSLLKNILNYLASRIVFFYKGNHYYKDFKTDNKIIKKIRFKSSSIKIKINNYWDYWRSIEFEKYPVELIYNEIKNDKEIIFYEIGANVGYSSLLISKFLYNSGKVYCFEVEPTNFKTLCDNIILNQLDNIIPFNIGISDSNSIEKFFYNTNFNQDKNYLPQSSMGSHSITFDSKIHKKNIACYVPMMNFRTIIDTFNLPNPTHIFIDAYGAEKKIIKSIIESDKISNCKKILVDIEEDEKIENTEVYNLLISNGFKLEIKFTENQVGVGSKMNAHHAVFSKK